MFSTLKISISTLQQNKSSSQFRIRSSEVSEEREKERKRERLNSSAHIAMAISSRANVAVVTRDGYIEGPTALLEPSPGALR